MPAKVINVGPDAPSLIFDNYCYPRTDGTKVLPVFQGCDRIVTGDSLRCNVRNLSFETRGRLSALAWRS